MGELSYELDRYRLDQLTQLVSGVREWQPQEGTEAGKLVRESGGDLREAPLPTPGKALLDGLIPRPFAMDTQELWVGGRLAKGVEAGTLDLLVEDRPDTRQRRTLSPPPEMFRAGDILVVAGHPATGQAGISMQGPLYEVGSMVRWPDGPLPTR